jgi:hypothetical protein
VGVRTDGPERGRESFYYKSGEPQPALHFITDTRLACVVGKENGASLGSKHKRGAGRRPVASLSQGIDATNAGLALPTGDQLYEDVPRARVVGKPMFKSK